MIEAGQTLMVVWKACDTTSSDGRAPASARLLPLNSAYGCASGRLSARFLFFGGPIVPLFKICGSKLPLFVWSVYS